MAPTPPPLSPLFAPSTNGCAQQFNTRLPWWLSLQEYSKVVLAEHGTTRRTIYYYHYYYEIKCLSSPLVFLYKVPHQSLSIQYGKVRIGLVVLFTSAQLPASNRPSCDSILPVRERPHRLDRRFPQHLSPRVVERRSLSRKVHHE